MESKDKDERQYAGKTFTTKSGDPGKIDNYEKIYDADAETVDDIQDNGNGKIDYYQVKVKSIELAADFQKLTASSDINSILQLSGIIAAFIVNKNNG